MKLSLQHVYDSSKVYELIGDAMRIAVSGSHSLGKSTVVNDWVSTYPAYFREEEPYRALSLNGPYQINFREESTKLQNGIQLYYNISRIHRYAESGSKVIFDRAPIDYIAYSQYTANHGKSDIDQEFIESMIPAIKESLDHLDIIAFIPKSDEWPVEIEEDGIRPIDHSYRDEVDTIFKEIYRNNRYDLMPINNRPTIIELHGPAEWRIEQLNNVIIKRQIQDP